MSKHTVEQGWIEYTPSFTNGHNLHKVLQNGNIQYYYWQRGRVITVVNQYRLEHETVVFRTRQTRLGVIASVLFLYKSWRSNK